MYMHICYLCMHIGIYSYKGHVRIYVYIHIKVRTDQATCTKLRQGRVDFRGKRDLFACQKRPTDNGIPEVLERVFTQIMWGKAIFPPYGS